MSVPAWVLASTTLFGAPQRSELLDAGELHLAIDALAAEHPGRVQVLPVGESRRGRLIQALRIGEGGEERGRPAILVVANLEGPLVWTSALALDLARALARGEGEGVAELLADTTVYVIPRANPDAAEARFETPLAEQRASGTGVDSDRDGRNGEDAPADVDGDGLVTTLRVPDPEGEWNTDPRDARILVKADRAKGERGRYALHPEGFDADGDEEIAEDPPLDAEVDANFAFRWEELAPRAGRYPTDEPEALALCEFVLAHPEIALVLTYGEEENLVRKPGRSKEGARGVESAGLLEEDATLVEELGRRYREATGAKTEGGEEQGGSFASWTYHHRGLVTLASSPWIAPAEMPDEKREGEAGAEAEGEAPDAAEAPPAPEGEEADEPVAGSDEAAQDSKEAEKDEEKEKPKEPEPSEEAKRLAWLEANGVADAFVFWRAFEHPTLGPVEIGGFRPYARVEPPADRFDALADAQLAFVVSLGDLLPRLTLVELEAKALAADLFEVTGALENDSLLPYASAMARAARSVRPARVRLQLAEGAELVAGAPQELVTELAGAGGRRELRWLVRAADASAIAVEVDSDHAGSFSQTPEVK